MANATLSSPISGTGQVSDTRAIARHRMPVAIAITPSTETAEVRSATQPQLNREKIPTASAIENRLAAR